MAEERKQFSMKEFVVKLFASFFFSGYLPKAPGTWAAGFTAITLYFIWPPFWYVQLLLIFAIYIIGVFFAGQAEQYLGHDARQIVIDEVAGQMVALFMAPRAILPYVMAFLLFRVFDIIKPPPACGWESLRGGLGVMADDIAAGAYAAIVMQFLLAVMMHWGIHYP
jgi:phosphatidylglycerophosphatase A